MYYIDRLLEEQVMLILECLIWISKFTVVLSCLPENIVYSANYLC